MQWYLSIYYALTHEQILPVKIMIVSLCNFDSVFLLDYQKAETMMPRFTRWCVLVMLGLFGSL